MFHKILILVAAVGAVYWRGARLSFNREEAKNVIRALLQQL